MEKKVWKYIEETLIQITVGIVSLYGILWIFNHFNFDSKYNFIMLAFVFAINLVVIYGYSALFKTPITLATFILLSIFIFYLGYKSLNHAKDATFLCVVYALVLERIWKKSSAKYGNTGK